MYMHGKKEAQVRSSTIYKIFTALRDRLKVTGPYQAVLGHIVLCW